MKWRLWKGGGATEEQFAPEARQMERDTTESMEAKELTLTKGTMIMANWHFNEPAPDVLEFLDHLDADGTSVGFQFNVVERTSSDETEIAIHVA